MPKRQLITLDQAAELLAVSPRTVRRMISDGTLTGYRLGPRLLRVDAGEIDRLGHRIDAA